MKNVLYVEDSATSQSLMRKHLNGLCDLVVTASLPKAAALLEERCKILRRLGLKAHWGSNIPQVMPEAFFAAYPQLRGPRVDHPRRSKRAEFTWCVDLPETLEMIEWMAAELKRNVASYREACQRW